MKKLFTFLILFSACAMMNNAQAQTCPEIDGLKPIPLQYGYNVFGQPSTTMPVLPGYWNRIYQLDTTTGNLSSTTCIFPCSTCYEYGACACFLTGIYFRRVTDTCDHTPCGGDGPLPQMPITNTNNSSSAWSAAATWVGHHVPDISVSLAAIISKPVQIDANLNLSSSHWLIFTGGNSSLLAGKTISCNSLMQINAAAQVENFGTINGSGQIFGSLKNSGILSPGNAVGKFTIVGNYTATTAAVHQIEIASANVYDTINISNDASVAGSGTAIINGVLNVTLLNGFIPSLGNKFKIFTFTSSTGNFKTADLPALPNGLCWSIEYNTSDITLEVVNTCTPFISIADKSVTEGNTGTVEMKFKVTLNNVSSKSVTVKFTTADSTATAGSDYITENGKLRFKPGQTSKTITVLVNGDTQVEPNEKFKLLLSDYVNATIADSIAIGTIKNDDVALLADNKNATAVKENQPGSFLKISPNPAQSQITVSGLSVSNANYIELIDMNGRSLLKQKIKAVKETIDLNSYKPGIYLLRYFDGSKWQQVKLVKQ